MLIEHKREIGAKPVRSRHCDGELAYKDVTRSTIAWEGVSITMILSQENYLNVDGKTLRETGERENLLLSSNRIPVRPPASREVFVILYVKEEIV